MLEKVTALYFSATENRKITSCTIAEELNKEYQKIDVTKWDSVTKDHIFSNDELVVFSAPVYAGRVYQGAMEKFSHFHGEQTKCERENRRFLC